jgi:hypothetical protein
MRTAIALLSILLLGCAPPQQLYPVPAPPPISLNDVFAEQARQTQEAAEKLAAFAQEMETLSNTVATLKNYPG